MIKKCHDVYGPKIDVKYANAMDSMLFETSQFSHIMCMFYTFYYLKSQEAFLRNCNKWLRHNGYLVIHIVNRNKFDPILHPSELFSVSPQKFMKEGERITKSLIKFNGYKYEVDFKEDYENNKGIFSEIFTDDDTGHIRKNVHTLLMKSRKQYEKMFLDVQDLKQNGSESFGNRLSFTIFVLFTKGKLNIINLKVIIFNACDHLYIFLNHLDKQYNYHRLYKGIVF